MLEYSSENLPNQARCPHGALGLTLLNLKWFLALSSSVVFAALLGCTPPPQFRENSLEWYKQERIARLEPGQSFAVHHRQDVTDISGTWFGTPDMPELPMLEGEEDALLEMLDPAKLKWAAGPVVSRNEESSQGLYRRHCAHCHGVTGDGAGPTSAFLTPYPRDFSLGRFKFKSSPTGTPPTKDDLRIILENGIPGTSMPSFRLLRDEEIDALTDYVIYLSMRGLVERFLIAAVRDLDDDERLVSVPAGMRFSELPADVQLGPLSRPVATDPTDPKDPSDQTDQADPTDPPFDRDTIEEDLLYLADEQLLPVVEKWLGILDFEPKDVDVPEWILDQNHSSYDSQVAAGQKLYFGLANCAQCHGETGLGDGQLNNYDDWTNDWLKVEGIDPTDPAAWAPYVNAGAPPPRPIPPRNLRLGVYRGGDRPIDIFRRIQNGIEGTPMPASLTLTDEQVWALVAYVRQLPYEVLSRPESAKKLENERPVR